MSSDRPDFTPAGSVSLLEAVTRVGKATVIGWDGEAVEILREVYSSSPYYLASPTFLAKRFPEKRKLPKRIADLVEAVAGPGEDADMLSSDEYMERVKAAAARWPSDAHPAIAQLEAVHAQMLRWIGDQAIRPFWYAADGTEVPIEARLARARNKTVDQVAFDALLLYGIAPVDGGGTVWVRELELNSALSGLRGTPLVGAAGSADPIAIVKINRGEIEKRYAARVKDLCAKGQRSSAKADLAFLKTLSPHFTRDRMRELRKKHVPEAWTKGGAPRHK